MTTPTTTETMYALFIQGHPTSCIGPKAEVEATYHWNRCLGNEAWSIEPVPADQVDTWQDQFLRPTDRGNQDLSPRWSTLPHGPLVDKLFDLVNQTPLQPQYHYEMWWIVKWIKQMPVSGNALVKVGNYNADFTDLSLGGIDLNNLQQVEDAHRHYNYWINDFKSGDAKAGIFCAVHVPKGLSGDAMVMQPEQAIALLNMQLGNLPERPKIDRPQAAVYTNRILHFHNEEAKQYFGAVMKDAAIQGLLPQFEQAIRDRCINYASNKVWYRCTLTPDSSPMSFGWSPEYKESADGEWKRLFPGGGGLIFHGPEHGWSTHT